MLNICCSDGGVLTPPTLLADCEEGTSDLNEPYDETFSAMRTATIPISDLIITNTEISRDQEILSQTEQSVWSWQNIQTLPRGRAGVFKQNQTDCSILYYLTQILQFNIIISVYANCSGSFALKVILRIMSGKLESSNTGNDDWPPKIAWLLLAKQGTHVLS